jgi:hypothetical protein
MKGFIKVSYHSNYDKICVYLRTANISQLREDDCHSINNVRTHVFMSDGTALFVNQKISEIFELMKEDNENKK